MSWSTQELPAGTITVELRADADVAVAAVVARRAAGRAGLGRAAAAEVATVAAELAANAVRHGGGGELHVWLTDERLHVVACDRGRVRVLAKWSERLLQAARPDADHGLGAVRRFMHHVDFIDAKGGGLCVRTWRRRTSDAAR